MRRSGSESGQLDLWSSTNAAGSSSDERGPECPATTTSEPTEERLACGFSLADPRVSPPAEQASGVGMQMTDGSGRKPCELPVKSAQLGACLRILLASEMWASREFSLAWKLSVTKCGCSIYRLAPSVRRIGERDTGSSATWRTPQRESENANRGNKPQSVVARKGHNISLRDQVPASWPTPARRDEKEQSQNPERNDYVPNVLKNNERSGSGSCGCLARTESFVERLMTLSAWLMGYTGAYLAHWETASSRKSRRGS